MVCCCYTRRIELDDSLNIESLNCADAERDAARDAARGGLFYVWRAAAVRRRCKRGFHQHITRTIAAVFPRGSEGTVTARRKGYPQYKVEGKHVVV